jgi:hypothetical protein
MIVVIPLGTFIDDDGGFSARGSAEEGKASRKRNSL